MEKILPLLSLWILVGHGLEYLCFLVFLGTLESAGGFFPRVVRTRRYNPDLGSMCLSCRPICRVRREAHLLLSLSGYLQ